MEKQRQAMWDVSNITIDLYLCNENDPKLSAWAPHYKRNDAVAQAAQGGGGVTIPESVQETWRCGNEGHGCGHGEYGSMTELDDLAGLFQP